MLLRRRLPDTQCGMRLHRASALAQVPLPAGGFESETRHLAACVHAGLRIAWVPIPAIYDGERSDFRPLHDSLKILATIAAGARTGRPGPRRARRSGRIEAAGPWPPEPSRAGL